MNDVARFKINFEGASCEPRSPYTAVQEPVGVARPAHRDLSSRLGSLFILLTISPIVSAS